MEEENSTKKISDGIIKLNNSMLIIGGVIFIVFVLILKSYLMHGWVKEDVMPCESWIFNSKEDMDNGLYCVFYEGTPENCKDVEGNKNTFNKACTCMRSNETINLYCNKKVSIYNYTKGYIPSKIDIRDSEKKIEKQYNISFDELFGRTGGNENE